MPNKIYYKALTRDRHSCYATGELNIYYPVKKRVECNKNTLGIFVSESKKDALMHSAGLVVKCIGHGRPRKFKYMIKPEVLPRTIKSLLKKMNNPIYFIIQKDLYYMTEKIVLFDSITCLE